MRQLGSQGSNLGFDVQSVACGHYTTPQSIEGGPARSTLSHPPSAAATPEIAPRSRFGHARSPSSSTVSSPIAVLSPHLDDAVLSCWGLLDGPGEVLVVNVFAGVPPDGAPRGWWDALANSGDPRDAMAARLAEDAAALGLAGRTPVNLGFVDRQYRDGDQPTEPIVEALLETLSPSSVVYAPAAIAPQMFDGGHWGYSAHPDHVAVRAAALALRAHGYRAALYADLPHASALGWPGWIKTDEATGRRDDEDGRWEETFTELGIVPEEREANVCRLTRREFARKVAAIRCYATQVPSLEWAFQSVLDEPDLLGYEVVWRLAEQAATPSSS